MVRFTSGMITRSQTLELFSSAAAAARVAGISRAATQQWKGSEEPVRSEHVLPFVRALGGRFRPYDFRPDIYPDPDWLPPDMAPGSAEIADDHGAAGEAA